jgi:hypothetical protein
MIGTLAKIVKSTSVEVKWWSYAAWTLPFAALGFISFEHYIGWSDDIINQSIIIITTVFFSVSVYWWWWALNKFLTILQVMEQNEDKFEEILDEIKRTRNELKQ